MSDKPILPPESPDEQSEAWETVVLDSARHFHYPPTPDIARVVRGRLSQPSRSPMYSLRLAVAAVVVLLAFSLAIPQVRSFVIEVIRIGAVRILYGEPTMTPFPTSSPNANPIDPVLELPGETSFSGAEQHFGEAFLLPSYPPDLGTPDHVYVDDSVGQTITLVWTQADNPAGVRLVMQILKPTAIAMKQVPWDFDAEQQTVVNGQEAVWLTGVHQITYFRYGEPEVRTVERNVLIWEQGELTYRLETDLTLQEAIRMAESLE